ncbi:Protein of unknown function [Pyronema omphalodes CBS 100304]|uniref:Uncharacterized protein n=1 Tax=Pyronema omphalodes (strain CBS 100304) TaxID=1076935 RepID=U4KVW1_PYROM|nr:Protein of unknown function [Pyronema omphalodes CBS 100304]
MPARAIFIASIAVVAAGAVIYENREKVKDNVKELAELTRAKLAEILRQLADTIGPERREEMLAMGGRGRGRDMGYDNGFDSDNEDCFARDSYSGLRQRGAQQPTVPQDQRTSVVFDQDNEKAYNEKNPLADPAPAPVAPVAPVLAAAAVAVPLATAAAIAVSSPTISSSPPATIIPIPSEPFVRSAIPIPAPPSSTATLQQTPTPASSAFESGYDTAAASVTPTAVVVPEEPFWSIHEWQAATVAESDTASSEPSFAGSDVDGQEEEVDVLSEFGSDGSDGGSEGSERWEEVGSVVSDEFAVGH